jgi:hypothetical protein
MKEELKRRQRHLLKQELEKLRRQLCQQMKEEQKELKLVLKR